MNSFPAGAFFSPAITSPQKLRSCLLVVAVTAYAQLPFSLLHPLMCMAGITVPWMRLVDKWIAVPGTGQCQSYHTQT